MKKRLQLLCMMLMVICHMLLTSSATAAPVPLGSLTEMPTLTEDGFLPAGADPVYYKNHQEGVWVYVDQTLQLRIQRHQQASPTLTYYVADIRAAAGVTPYMYSYNQERPGRTNGLPQTIANDARAVYAQSGDFYSYRVAKKKRPGVIIRNGEALHRKTNGKLFHAVPNLATLAFFPTGEAEVHEAFEMDASDFLERQATDVLAFGPVLIRNGEVQDLSNKAYRHKEPRSAFGMIDAGHYVGLLVEGRSNHSEGAALQQCAALLSSLGVTNALNLDGGNTAAMLFMGESVMMNDSGGVDENDRAIPDILMVGTY